MSAPTTPRALGGGPAPRAPTAEGKEEDEDKDKPKKKIPARVTYSRPHPRPAHSQWRRVIKSIDPTEARTITGQTKKKKKHARAYTHTHTTPTKSAHRSKATQRSSLLSLFFSSRHCPSCSVLLPPSFPPFLTASKPTGVCVCVCGARCSRMILRISTTQPACRHKFLTNVLRSAKCDTLLLRAKAFPSVVERNCEMLCVDPSLILRVSES